MAGFRTTYEQRKWDSLKGQEKAALTRVMSGKGKPEDFKALESLVAKYDALAGQIMKRVLRSIEDSVNRQLNQQRTLRETYGDRPLSEEETRIIMDDALEAAWKEQGPELVVIVEESVVKALREQEQQTQNEFSKRLQEQLGPKQEFTIDDLVEYLTNPANQKARDAEWDRRMEQLYQQFDSIQDALYYMQDRIEARAEIGALRAIRRYVSGESEQRAYERTGRSPKDILNSQLASNQVHDQEKTETLNSARKFEQIIVDAIKNQDTTLQEIRDRLNNLKQSDSDRRRKDSERADAYSRSLKKNGFGSRVAKAGGVGLMAGLGILGAKLLLSELMGGKVWQELSKFFSEGTIEDFAKRFLDLLETAGRAVADYIAKQFKDSADARDRQAGVRPDDNPAVAQARRDLLAAQSNLDYLKQNFPDMVDSQQKRVDQRKKELDELVDIQEENRKGSKGPIGSVPTSGASGTPPAAAGGSTAPGSAPPPSGGLPEGTAPGTPFPGSSTPAAGSSRPLPAPMSSPSGESSTSQSSSPPMSPAPVAEPPPPLTPVGSPSASTSQAVGGPIASAQNMRWRPNIDGTMPLINAGMLS